MNAEEGLERYADSMQGNAPHVGEAKPNGTISTGIQPTMMPATSPSSAADATCSQMDGLNNSKNLPNVINQKLLLPGGIKPYYHDETAGIAIFLGDCREILPTLGHGSARPIDLVLTDPPYGITSNAWDNALPASKLLSIFHTVVMTTGQPFAAQMICADLKRFRHEWVWVKNRGSNFANTVREPMKEHETVLVFSDGKWTYNPQSQNRNGTGGERAKYVVKDSTASDNYRKFKGRESALISDERVPSSVQYFNTETGGSHPTRKPLALFKYLTLTYSNEGETVLDPFMGSGTTLKAAKDLGRKAIGIEIEERYCEIAANRLAQEVLSL
ncbi:hypothetical protein LCGC14_0378570 [marine sediment metagenome]|uniref:DNA methylase N-4/N-6 domain-containing protein n=1 Tax=marine sediment metagenome TaxID=412755 RepID=A0A0F9T8R3_9ZZZZ